jgi:hypothetical protein
MARLFREVPRLLKRLQMIEQYNNFAQLGATEDIIYLKEKVNNLYNLKDDAEKLIAEFTYCAETVNMFYYEIDKEFIERVLADEEKDF